MEKKKYNSFLSHKGFSLVEVLVGIGLMTGTSLIVTHLIKQGDQVKKISEMSKASLDISARMQSLLSNKASCHQTLVNLSLNIDQTIEIDSVKNQNGTPVFKKDGTYFDNKIKISYIGVERRPDGTFVLLRYEKLKGTSNGLKASSSQILKKFHLNAEYKNNILLSCDTSLANHEDEAVKKSIKQMCQGRGLIYNSTENACKAKGQFGEFTSGINCPEDHAIQGVTFNSISGEYEPRCVKNQDLGSTTCLDNQVFKRSSDGSYSCVTIQCPPNGVFKGINPLNGKSDCLICKAGEVPVYTSSDGWICSSLNCINAKNSSQQYLAGVGANGVAICNNLIDASASPCSSGKLGVKEGKVVFDCCNESCSDSGNHCLGKPYASSSGCGSCVGTKPHSCEDAGLHCLGEIYASSDSCGTCVGIKSPKIPFWGEFVATQDLRVKEGALCKDGNISIERKYSRTCQTDTACGGSLLSCVGVKEEWREDGEQKCTQ